jgi:hypothetical protein
MNTKTAGIEDLVGIAGRKAGREVVEQSARFIAKRAGSRAVSKGATVLAKGAANPAFIVGLEEHTSGAVESTGDPGLSSGSDSTGGAGGSEGVGSTGDGTTAVEPGTTTSGPSTTTTTTTTTGDPSTTGSSTGGSTTGGLDEQTICQGVYEGTFPIGPPLLDMASTPCIAQWTGSDTQNPNLIVEAVCGATAPQGFALGKPGIVVNPGEMFLQSLITGTQALPSRSGTIEGVFSSIDLAGMQHPCFLATVACVVDQPGPCSLDIQVFIKSSQSGDWGTPALEIAVDDQALQSVAIPLADYTGQPIDILLVVQNDKVGAPQEIVAWERPLIAEAFP